MNIIGITCDDAEMKTKLRSRNLQGGGGGGGDGDVDGRQDQGERDGPPPPGPGDLNIRFNKILIPNDGDGDGRQYQGERVGPPPPEPGDLNIRFNKILFPNGGPAGLLPLRARDFPVRGATADILKTQSRGSSIVTADDYELHGANATNYMNLIGGPPSMPNSNPDHEYWDDLRHVIQVQLNRRNGLPKDPNTLIRFPDLWSSFDIHAIAKAVQDEYPGYHQEMLLQWLWADGVEIDQDIFPFRSDLDFIGKQVRLADLNTWAVGVVAPVSFHAKWFAGRPRPEEVAWMVSTGKLTTQDHGVPADIVADIQSMKLGNASAFTAYPSGCPQHPSWPGMHGAASSASLWLAVVIKDMTAEQYCEALRVDYAVAYARTVAGVHYATDNIAGLNLGKEVMLDKLADYLAETYASNRAVVQAKIERMAFDWAKFNSYNCTVD